MKNDGLPSCPMSFRPMRHRTEGPADHGHCVADEMYSAREAAPQAGKMRLRRIAVGTRAGTPTPSGVARLRRVIRDGNGLLRALLSPNLSGRRLLGPTPLTKRTLAEAPSGDGETHAPTVEVRADDPIYPLFCWVRSTGPASSFCT
jgi:hypothetical protein